MNSECPLPVIDKIKTALKDSNQNWRSKWFSFHLNDIESKCLDASKIGVNGCQITLSEYQYPGELSPNQVCSIIQEYLTQEKGFYNVKAYLPDLDRSKPISQRVMTLELQW